MTHLVKSLFSRRQRPAWMVLATCLLLAWIAWSSLREQATRAAEQQFGLHVSDVVDAINDRMRQNEQILLGGVGLFEATDHVSRAAWHTYVERLQLARNYPGIQGVGFSQLIAPADLQAHVASVRAEGFPQYTIRPPGARALYTAIIYLEPFSNRNLAAFGYDMLSEATRAKAMRLAAETEKTTITGKVTLVQETHGKPQAGFLMYTPLYQKDQPRTTPAERWKALRGFVYSPFRLNDLMRGILGDQIGPLDFSLFDGTQEDEATRLYASHEDTPAQARATPPLLTAVRTIHAYGTTWTVRFQSRPEFEARFYSSLNMTVPVLGGTVSVLLFFLVSFLLSRREQAEEMARQMTVEIRASERLAQERAQQNQSIFDGVIDGILTIDSRGTVQSMNRAAEAIFGFETGEVLGRNVKLLMPEPYHSQHDGYLKNYRDTGVPRIIGIGREVVGRRKDGSTFPMDLAVSQSAHQGQPLFIGLVRDISERKRVEQMKTEFVSTVSHELRTPLTSISGALGLVCGGALGPVTEQAKTMLDIAHKNSQRLTHLINDLLDMEKLAAGKMHFELQTQELMPLVEQSIEGIRAYAQPYQVQVLLQERADGVRVRVDGSRLQQVLSNLLSNAAKFSPQGGLVEVRVRRDQNVVRVDVLDHGPGIPDEFRGRIFQKFSQADASDTRKKGGTGLGLAISKELIEHMNGLMGFESQPGQGACFHFELPVAVELAPPLEKAGQDRPDSARLLVVEDDPDIAQLLLLMLNRAGYNADVAGSGEQALQLLAQHRYAAITLDLMLPGLSGVSLIRQLRSQPEFEALPIIVVSAYLDDGKLALNGEFVALDWIDKPIDEARLIDAVRRQLPPPHQGKVKILHVEDDADLHRIVAALGRDVAEFDVAPTLAQARARLRQEHYQLVILDIGLPDGSGWSLLPEINALQPAPRVIVLSGIELSAAQQRAVHQVLLKSRSSNERLLATIQQAIGHPAVNTSESPAHET